MTTGAPEITRLLQEADGTGKIFVVSPGRTVMDAAAETGPSHYYTGVTTAPCASLLQSLLLAIGGRLVGDRDSELRYKVIAVASAGDTGVHGDTGGADYPEQFAVRGKPVHGPTFWFQRVAKGDGSGADLVRRRRGVEPTPPGHQSEVIPLETGARFPSRHIFFSQKVTELLALNVRAALLIDVACLDLLRDDDAAAHQEVEDVGKMHAFKDLLGRPPLDIFFYGRNLTRTQSLLGEGLPNKRQVRVNGEPALPTRWRQFTLRGKRAVEIEWPTTGPVDDLFNVNPVDGEANRLKECLETHRLARPRARAEQRRGLEPRKRDHAFWSGIEWSAVIQDLATNYFLRTGDDTSPLRKLLDLAGDPATSDKAWKTASNLVLFGAAGMGKTSFAKQLCNAVFGHDAFVLQVPQANFEKTFLGAEPSFIGSDVLQPVGRHILATRGYTVVCLDEIGNLRNMEEAKCLFRFVDERQYSPLAAHLVPGGSVPAWNTIIVATGNLPEWPPSTLQADVRDAFERRFTPVRFDRVRDEELPEFVAFAFRRQLAKCDCYAVVDDLRVKLAARVWLDQLPGREKANFAKLDERHLSSMSERVADAAQTRGREQVRLEPVDMTDEVLQELGGSANGEPGL